MSSQIPLTNLPSSSSLSTILLTPLETIANSELTLACEAFGLKVAHEVFANRTYQRNGQLTPRSEKNSITANKEDAIQQVLKIVQIGKVETTCGEEVHIDADTVCIHGDHPQSLAFAKSLKAALQKNNGNVLKCPLS